MNTSISTDAGLRADPGRVRPAEQDAQNPLQKNSELTEEAFDDISHVDTGADPRDKWFKDGFN